MRIFKKKYFYYDPKLQKGDFGYMVDIYYYDGKKAGLVKTYVDEDYKKVLEKARDFCDKCKRFLQSTDKPSEMN